MIPLALTRTTAPIFSEPETLSIGQMIKLSPSGVSTCFVSGMILGSIYGLYPIFIQNSGYPTAEISIIMGLTIFGGMVFQYPFGRLSDLISRRYVIAFLALMSSVLCVAIIEIGKDNVYIISILSFLLGGTTFCLYPIGISHT
ncbi:MFS transporter, partial [Bacillus halotolerans]